MQLGVASESAFAAVEGAARVLPLVHCVPCNFAAKENGVRFTCEVCVKPWS